MRRDDPLLMAYADGELDGAERARVEAAIAADPRLAEAVEGHRALREQLRSAWASVLEEPVPERLQRAAAAPRRSPADARAKRLRERRRVSGTRTWIGWAVAAALALGLALGALLPRWRGDVIERTATGQWVAAGVLSEALETGLAAREDGPVRVGLTFRDGQGQWCRSFTLAEATYPSGLACRAEGRWAIVVLAQGRVSGSELAQAGTALPPAVLAAIDQRLQGEVLDAGQERAARDAGWR